MVDHKTVQETLHANMDILWDTICLIDGALAHEDLENATGAQRLVRMAKEKLQELDGILSPLI